MFKFAANLLGRHLLHRTITQAAPQIRQLFDVQLGLRLLRDSRVPLALKIQSLLVGFLALGVLEMLELPLQTALMFLLPFVGLAADLALDGVEFLAVPLLVASVVLPHLLPQKLREDLDRFARSRVWTVSPGQTR